MKIATECSPEVVLLSVTLHEVIEEFYLLTGVPSANLFLGDPWGRRVEKSAALQNSI